MAKRPTRVDALSSPSDPLSRPLFAPQGPAPVSPSPVPPALSPLDALAMQGHLLAKKFEQENNAGRRMSRLPPVTIANELAKTRPGYYRAMTTGSQLSSIPSKPQKEEGTDNRPVSHYPQMILTDSASFGKSSQYHGQLYQLVQQELNSTRDTFSMPRSHSPDEIDAMSASPPLPPANMSSSLPNYSLGSSLLAPPSRAQPQTSSPSIRAVRLDHQQDEMSQFMLEKPNPPFRNDQPMRSPSVTSDRPSFNYSRPISRTGRTSPEPNNFDPRNRRPLDVPAYRQDSSDTATSPYSNDGPQTPVSLAGDEFSSPDMQFRGGDSTPSSYVYTKYALGRKQRESVGIEEFMNRQFNWDDGSTETQLPPFALAPALHPPPSPALTNSPPWRDTPSEGGGSPRARRKLQKPRAQMPAQVPSETSTVRISPSNASSRVLLAARDQPAEESLQRGIELHEAGSLQESTYYLRLAAKAGHPTAMVLYALACRHGWGMKPNAQEGVSWLQKAVDSAQLEVAEDEDQAKHGLAGDTGERKTHKAQFALGVYELGVSYMNGWGVTQDKGLGVRCFEIAGNWGDADALGEAAYCYKEGIGVRKDMRKAARLYRVAETKGITVAGNSWIHKDKYLEPTDDSDDRIGRAPTRKSTSDSNKKREKSRTRAFFSRNKSNAS